MLGNAYRLGSYALFLIAVYAAFRFLRREFGPAEAWGAALSLPLVPVLFGFARLGTARRGRRRDVPAVHDGSLYGAVVYGGRGRTVLGRAGCSGWRSPPS